MALPGTLGAGRRALGVLGVLVGFASVVAAGEARGQVVGAQARLAARYVPRLERFGTREAFDAYVRLVRAARWERDGRGGAVGWGIGLGGGGYGMGTIGAGSLGTIGAAGAVTNNQVAGVDEGGIVKLRGEHLVVLRRGRLFTVDLGGDGLTPTSELELAPGGRARDVWYDELLVRGDTAVVVGFDYGSAAVELVIVDIDRRGRLRRRDTRFLRADDYFSDRNYASRLVGRTLLFYMPVPIFQESWELGSAAPLSVRLPAARRPGGGWFPLVDPAELYLPIQPIAYGDWPVLHTVVACTIGSSAPRCRARGVLGPDARTFYVSGTAVYLWVTSDAEQGVDAVAEQRTPRRAPLPAAVLYRLPLDGPGVEAVRVSGAPIDQFSFHEHPDGNLYVLVTSDGGGDAMWRSAAAGGDLALVRVPLGSFGRRARTIPSVAYVPLAVGGLDGELVNRFVGDHLLVGAGVRWGTSPSSRGLGVIDVHAPTRLVRLELGHSIDRLEPLGHHAVAIGGSDSGLGFTAVRLDGEVRAEGTQVLAGAVQGELRSHGFFYRDDGDGGGTLGLPFRAQGDHAGRHLVASPAGVAFLDVRGLRFRELGALLASAGPVRDDGCVVSCVDWYGNARPVFYGDRIFALLGYELVEGAPAGAAIRERRRVDFLDRPRLTGPP